MSKYKKLIINHSFFYIPGVTKVLRHFVFRIYSTYINDINLNFVLKDVPREALQNFCKENYVEFF
jgi:hypothetical protein